MNANFLARRPCPRIVGHSRSNYCVASSKSISISLSRQRLSIYCKATQMSALALSMKQPVTRCIRHSARGTYVRSSNQQPLLPSCALDLEAAVGSGSRSKNPRRRSRKSLPIKSKFCLSHPLHALFFRFGVLRSCACDDLSVGAAWGTQRNSFFLPLPSYHGLCPFKK